MVAGRVRSVAAVLIAVAAMAAPAMAQVTTGTISGTIKDSQGAVVPGAAVTLTSETRGTKLEDVFTNANGDFTFVNVPPDRYTAEIKMSGFKPAKQSGINVSPGDRLSIGTFTIEVGGLSDTVVVKAESPLVQAASGERSFVVPTTAVENLPIGNRSFTELAKLAPGVTTINGSGDPGRIGGGGDTNIMMDGVGVMDTGSNRPLLQMNVESIAEVKILTSGYQAEYGRSSGMQITAVTKSGTNRFRGSVYDVQRDSDWNSNDKRNKLNGDPKGIVKEKDWGYSIGGPIGKPGGSNKLFFFYSQEFSPRKSSGDVQNFRVPTALERAGDFSQTLDQNGALYNLIKDPLNSNPCSATNTSGCFQDGGVVGKIPADRLYQTGLNILKLFPLPNAGGPGIGFNYTVNSPASILSWQPAVRVDYQPSTKLRVTGKYSGWQQRRDVVPGLMPGFNDTQMQRPVISNLAFSANYNLSNTMFLEGTYGRSRNELAGCALAQTGTGPNFCRAAVPMNPNSYRVNAGLGSLPLLFPDANKLNPAYYAAQALNKMNPAPPAWVNGDFQKVPAFTWGSRVNPAPPNIPFPTYFNVNATQDVSVSLTKVMGRHTMKAGYFNTHSFKAEQATGADSFGTIGFGQDTNNLFDTTYGFANAAIGTFSSYTQAQNYVEGDFVYDNREAYAQDNWKVNNRLTLDYGMRFVHASPQYDKLGQGSNFLPDKWTIGNAPQLYKPGCAVSPIPATGCPAASQQALNPVTGQLLGPNTSAAIGTLVPGSGSPTNGIFQGGNGIVKTTYTYPALTFAPRFGAAYDMLGDQSLILRGGAGIFYDRPFGNSVISMPGNPPASRLVTARYALLQSLGTGGLTTQGAPGLNTIDYEAKLPTSFQFSSGIQKTLPWATVVDFEWVGQHSYNTVRSSVNINLVDFGAAFLPQNQNPNAAAGLPLGSGAVSTDLMRAYRGYGSINMRQFNGWRTFHSLQMSLNRRFRDGFSFGFNDTWVLYDHQNGAARLQHAADGSWSVRDDQAKAWDMLNTFIPNSHILKGNFVWDLPDLHMTQTAWKAVGYIVNDWQFSGVWTGSTNGPTSTQFNAAAGKYSVGYSYSNGGGNVNITGSPDYGGRVRIVGDPGSGCSSDMYRQFNAAAFQGPLPNSDGLESGAGYLGGCFQSVLDTAIARNIRLGGGRNLQLRVDMFNALNEARITNRNTTMNLSSPGDPMTITNLPYDTNGNILPSRVKPNNAGFGQATRWQPPRSVQVQIRFSF